jgi:malic enzyme
MDNKNKDYENLLREHMGLFSINIKLPVKDVKTLALVYTPGVAANCLEIQKNQSKAYKYTNKLNSMIVVTDSSAYTNQEWNNYAGVPYLEAFCVYYKTIANIDCYPFVLDLAMIKSAEDLQDTIDHIMPSFSAVEFFGVSKERMSQFKTNGKYAFIDGSNKRQIDTESIIPSNQLYGAIIRAALDTQAYINLNEVLEYVLKEIHCDGFKLQSCKSNFKEVLKMSTQYILEKGLSTQTSVEFNLDQQNLSVEYVMSKYRRFLLEGADGWVDTFPHGYISNTHTNDENSLLLHSRYRGVIQTDSKIKIKNFETLDEIFTWDNLDYISKKIIADPFESNFLTCRSNLGAIITNGTAILGLGDIGALSGMPVMEGKSVLFKLYGGTDITPICIEEKNPQKFIEIVQRITPIFSIINLEDIKAPECFNIEPTLNDRCDFPVFHDDQHGTAVVTLAGLINALKITNKSPENIKVVMNGAGAAGLSITQLLLEFGVNNFVICDTEGAIYEGREKNMNEFKNMIAKMTNRNQEKGKLVDVIKGADVVIGVSAPKSITKEMVSSMNEKAIVFALANPTPEIYPEEAIEAGAFIVATGRSDFPNQINNSLAFPGIFRGAVDLKLKDITIPMKIVAAKAIANLVDADHLKKDYIIPGSLDPNVSISVARSLAEYAFNNNLSRNKNISIDLVQENISSWFLEGKLKNFDFIEKKHLQWSK